MESKKRVILRKKSDQPFLGLTLGVVTDGEHYVHIGDDVTISVKKTSTANQVKVLIKADKNLKISRS